MTEPFQFDPDSPLKRAKGESKRANAALQDYAYMGDGRSLNALFERYTDQRATNPQLKPPTTQRSTLGGWSAKFAWVERVAAWDDIESERIEEQWRKRRFDLRETYWQKAESLLEIVDRGIAEAPNFIRTRRRTIRGRPRIITDGRVTDEGEPDREIITMALSVGDLARLLKLASDLQRLNAELETERVANDLNGLITTQTLPTADISDMDETQQAEALFRQSRVSDTIARRLAIQSKSGDVPSTDSRSVEVEDS